MNATSKAWAASADDDLLAPLVASYRAFLQPDVAPEARLPQGLHRALGLLTTREDLCELTYESYSLERPRYDVSECMRRGLYYVAALRVVVRLVVFEEPETKNGPKPIRDVKEQEVYMGELPLMTGGAFIVAGERRYLPIRTVESCWLPEDGDRESTPPRRRRMLPGDWVQHAVGEGVLEMSDAIRGFLNRTRDLETLMPHDLINARPIMMNVRTLLEKRTSPLDEGNPLWRVERLRAIEEPLASLTSPKTKGRPKPSKKTKAEAAPPSSLPFRGDLEEHEESVTLSDMLVPFTNAPSHGKMRGALVPVGAEAPKVATGLEGAVARAAGIVRLARTDGELEILDDRTAILWRASSSDVPSEILHLEGLRGASPLREVERWTVANGAHVRTGDVIAESDGACEGVLALGCHAHVSIHDGASEGGLVVTRDFAAKMATRRFLRYEAVTRDTPFGREELTTRVGPSVAAPSQLDEAGIVRLGATVGPGDALVGISTWARIPKSRQEIRSIYEHYRSLSPEEREEEGMDPEDDVPRVPRPVVVKKGDGGVVVCVESFFRRGQEENSREAAERDEEQARIDAVVAAATKRLGSHPDAEALAEQAKDAAYTLRRGSDLPPGVIRMVRVTIEQTIPLEVGDELRDRHGFGGVVQRIVPAAPEDVAFHVGPAPEGTHKETETGALYLLRLGRPATKSLSHP